MRARSPAGIVISLQRCALAAVLLCAVACTTKPAQSKSNEHAMSKLETLHEWMKLRELSPAALEKELGITSEHMATGRSYAKLGPVTQWHDPQAHPGYFFFRDDALVLIYVDDEKALRPLAPGDLREALGEAEAALRSRAGKRVPLHVHAAKGLSYAADKDTVYYLEIFPPMSLEDYRANLYKEPPPYRK